MVVRRCARLRLPPGVQAPAARTSLPGLESPPRSGWALAPHLPLRGSPAAGRGRRMARTWSRRPGLTCARPALPPPAWRRRTCGGASRAGPASGVKATATALGAGRQEEPEDHFVGLVQDNFGDELSASKPAFSFTVLIEGSCLWHRTSGARQPLKWD